MSVFFVGTAHDEYRTRRFPEGSVVIDPWRMIPDQAGVTVRRLGENKPELISLLVPSRGRPEMLGRMIRSAYETAVYPRSLEVWAYLDDDDPRYIDYIVDEDCSPARFIQGDRALLSECWNRCAKATKAEILMHAGDDITFNTPGWDQRVREEFAKIPDRIGLVYADDLSTNFPDLATHGFVHRRWVETVGYFLPPLFSCDWNDVWLTEVAQKIGRAVPMPDVVIEHHHYTFNKAEYDQTHKEREERGREDDVVGIFQRTAKERANDAAKLKKVMA